MIVRTIARRCGGFAAPRTVLAATVAVTAAAMASTAAVAQNVPYEAAQRAGIGRGLGQEPLPRGGVFQPRVDTALQYVDNMQLAPDGQPKITLTGIELVPGFYASYSSGSAIGAIDYALIGRAWFDDDSFNEVSQRLAANGQWLAIPDWFSVRGQASYQDAVIDPFASVNYGYLGLFDPGNLTEVATASVNPILQHRFKLVEFQAQYAYGRTWYFDEGKGEPTVGFVVNQDSTDEAASVSLGTPTEGARLSGRMFYEWQRSEYDNALPYRYERAGVAAGWQVDSSLALVGNYGKESDLDASSVVGGLDSEFWDVGLRWQRDDRSLAEARYGERFWGSTYYLNLRHRARLLEFVASYQEYPTVETRTLSLGEFEPGELPPTSPDLDFGRSNTTPYVARAAQAGVSLIGSRTTLRLSGMWSERDYLDEVRGGETDVQGVIDLTRQLASNLSADVTLRYTDQERELESLPAQPRAFDSVFDTEAVFGLNRESGQHLTLSGQVGYLQRTGNGDGNYDGWWVGLRARYRP